MPFATISRNRRSRALSYLAAAAILVLMWMSLPVGTGLFLGALVAFTLQPIHRRLCARGMRESVAAALCAALSTLVVAVAVGVMTTLFVSRAIVMGTNLPAFLAPGGALQQTTDRWSKALAPMHITADQVTNAIRNEAMSVLSSLAGSAATAAGQTFGALLTTIFLALSTYSVLLYWAPLMRHAEGLLPLEPRHTHALFEQLRRVGRQVLRGTIITGLLQGVAAALVYWVTGVNDPIFWGALTALASLVPAVGTLLIWVPMGVYLMATRHVGAGIGELVGASVFVGLIPDYVIRPRLVGNEKGIPTIVTFVSLFGGIEVFGLVGLVLGPVIAAMAIAVLKTYEAELEKETRAAAVLANTANVCAVGV
jgi:predicted PurR-regulated permease PerM